MKTSFNKLLKSTRIRKASYMLMASDASIEAISESVGYKNVNYFYRVF